jgi:NADH dehydrogenase
MRLRTLIASEAAEREANPGRRRAQLSFVILGGGTTGTELVGAIGELTHDTLKGHFRRIDPADARIILVEHAESLLPPYPGALAVKPRSP